MHQLDLFAKVSKFVSFRSQNKERLRVAPITVFDGLLIAVRGIRRTS